MKQVFLAVITLLLIVAAGCSETPSTLPYPMQVNDEGIGPLRSSTPFNASVVNGLLPGFEVRQFTAFEAGSARSVLRVTRGSEEVFTIHPDHRRQYIGLITITHPGITLSGMPLTGTPVRAADSVVKSCTQEGPAIRCRSASHENVHLLADAHSGRFTAIIWKPDARN